MKITTQIKIAARRKMQEEVRQETPAAAYQRKTPRRS